MDNDLLVFLAREMFDNFSPVEIATAFQLEAFTRCQDRTDTGDERGADDLFSTAVAFSEARKELLDIWNS